MLVGTCGVLGTMPCTSCCAALLRMRICARAHTTLLMVARTLDAHATRTAGFALVRVMAIMQAKKKYYPVVKSGERRIRGAMELLDIAAEVSATATTAATTLALLLLQPATNLNSKPTVRLHSRTVRCSDRGTVTN